MIDIRHSQNGLWRQNDAFYIINEAWYKARIEVLKKTELVLSARKGWSKQQLSLEWQALLCMIWQDNEERLILNFWNNWEKKIDIGNLTEAEVIAIATNPDSDHLEQIAKDTKNEIVLSALACNKWANNSTLNNIINSEFLNLKIVYELISRVNDEWLLVRIIGKLISDKKYSGNPLWIETISLQIYNSKFFINGKINESLLEPLLACFKYIKELSEDTSLWVSSTKVNSVISIIEGIKANR